MNKINEKSRKKKNEWNADSHSHSTRSSREDSRESSMTESTINTCEYASVHANALRYPRIELDESCTKMWPITLHKEACR